MKPYEQEAIELLNQINSVTDLEIKLIYIRLLLVKIHSDSFIEGLQALENSLKNDLLQKRTKS